MSGFKAETRLYINGMEVASEKIQLPGNLQFDDVKEWFKHGCAEFASNSPFTASQPRRVFAYAETPQNGTVKAAARKNAPFIPMDRAAGERIIPIKKMGSDRKGQNNNEK